MGKGWLVGTRGQASACLQEQKRASVQQRLHLQGKVARRMDVARWQDGWTRQGGWTWIHKSLYGLEMVRVWHVLSVSTSLPFQPKQRLPSTTLSNRSFPLPSSPLASLQVFPVLLNDSPYVTTDPEEADYLCMGESGLRWLRICVGGSIRQGHQGTSFPCPVSILVHSKNRSMIDIQAIANQPYWDRKGGRDHIFTVVNDQVCGCHPLRGCGERGGMGLRSRKRGRPGQGDGQNLHLIKDSIILEHCESQEWPGLPAGLLA
jgi:hypothetical protein